MPFVVEQISTGKRICAFDYENTQQIRDSFQASDIRCPFCKAEMILVGSNLKAIHWRHRAKMSTCPSVREGESLLHFMAKKRQFEILKAKSEIGRYTVQVEYRFPDAGKNGRIADIAMFCSDGSIVVIEIQLSKISVEELEARTADYLEQGIFCIWVFGETALDANVMRWSYINFGGYHLVQFDDAMPRFSDRVVRVQQYSAQAIAAINQHFRDPFALICAIKNIPHPESRKG